MSESSASSSDSELLAKRKLNASDESSQSSSSSSSDSADESLDEDEIMDDTFHANTAKESEESSSESENKSSAEEEEEEQPEKAASPPNRRKRRYETRKVALERMKEARNGAKPSEFMQLEVFDDDVEEPEPEEEEEEEEVKPVPKKRTRKTAVVVKDDDEEEDEEEEEKPKRTIKPRKKPAPRLKRVPKAVRDLPSSVFSRMEGLTLRDDIDDFTSWDVGETYMAPVRMSYRKRELVKAASWNLKWGRDRETIRFEIDMLVEYIKKNPDICTDGIKVWVIEEQFDSSVAKRNAFRNFVSNAEVVADGDKCVITIESKFWTACKEAVDEEVWKGPVMPLLETALRTAARMAGIEVVSILPRHTKKAYGLPCAGHDANKVLSEGFVVPRLNDTERALIKIAADKRHEENIEHADKDEERLHDYHEAWLNGMLAMSAWSGENIVASRQVNLYGKPTAAGYILK